MMWVVFGHCYSFLIAGAENITSFTSFANKPFFLIVEAGILSVDVFFFLGGFSISTPGLLVSLVPCPVECLPLEMPGSWLFQRMF